MNVFEVFTGNPLHTPVGQRIDKATDGSLETEDWACNMEICDIINETDEGPKDAIRAIRKKLNNSVAKDWRSVHYCLVVLETCVKNCGRRFHLQVANRDFLQDLIKIISPKNEPSVSVQEKVLSLIQTWADAFRGAADLRAVEAAYQELKQKGIEFPATDLDHMAPIHTPKGTNEPQRVSPTRPQTHAHPSVPQVHHPQRHGKYSKLEDDGDDDSVREVQTHATMPAATLSAPRQPSSEQMSKLRADIDIVQGNCRVFNEMLNVATPGSSDLTADTIDLMRELNRTCRQMQQRIVVLIEQLADEQVTEVLLRVNDDLNNAFLRYDRLERMLSASATTKTTSNQTPASQPPTSHTPASLAPANHTPNSQATAPKTNEAEATPPSYSDALIDLGITAPSSGAAAGSLSAQLDSLALHSPSNISNVKDVPAAKPGDDDDFDVFAQSRQYDAAKHSVANSYAFQAEAADANQTMSSTMGRANPYAASEAPQESSATSSEFDRFLEERAAAGDELPDRQPNGGHGTSSRAPQRELKKDESENALFAL